MEVPFVIAVHGGAADYRRQVVGEERVAAGLRAVSLGVEAGRAVLDGGGAAIEAVVAAVRVLEDEPVLNAGRGAALTLEGFAELDAAVADGAHRRSGAVAAVRRPRNPVDAALAVLRHGRHVLLAGEGADRFAARSGVVLADPEWFITERQRAALQQATPGDRGTVGAVALDVEGHVAAATSTGGIQRQEVGRVGDAPIVGAGTWADDRTAAVSATGAGEAFLGAVFAHHVHLRMLLLGDGLDDACVAALDVVAEHGGQGGCVAVTARGEISMPFSTPAMFRGWCRQGGAVHVGVEPEDIAGT